MFIESGLSENFITTMITSISHDWTVCVFKLFVLLFVESFYEWWMQGSFYGPSSLFHPQRPELHQ